MYQIEDRQTPGRLFADGSVYPDKESVRLQLIDYHSIDWEEELDINKLTLDEVLEYGEWEIVERE